MSEVTILTEMLGKVTTEILGAEKQSEEIAFRFSDRSSAKFWHEPDCCESVRLEEIVGDLTDLIGQPLLTAECVTDTVPESPETSACTWTFYKFSTIAGSVTFRWYGESNGYYSEEVAYEYLPVPASLDLVPPA